MIKTFFKKVKLKILYCINAIKKWIKNMFFGEHQGPVKEVVFDQTYSNFTMESRMENYEISDMDEDSFRRSRHRYILSKSELHVMIDIGITTFPESSYYETQPNTYLSYHISEDNCFLRPIISMGSKKLEIAVPHTLLQLSEDEQSRFKSVNPMVYVKDAATINNKYYHFKSNKKADIYTYCLEDNKYIVINTMTDLVINVAVVKSNSNPVISTIGVVINIDIDISPVWSGSIVMVDRKLPMIISSGTKTIDGRDCLLAWAAVEHGYLAKATSYEA